jgi:hypothetical protein
VITPREEHALIERFESLRWDPIVIRGQAARGTARHSIPPTKQLRYSITFPTLK